MSERSRNDKGQFAPTVDTEGVPSVQETPEQRERNNLTLVAEKNSGCNSLASPGSIGTADDIASKTETAQEVHARLEQSEIHIFLQGIRHIISEAHARDLIKVFPLVSIQDLGLVTEEDLRCDSPAGIWTGANKKGGLEPMRRKDARLFTAAVTAYLHCFTTDTADIHDTHGPLNAQALQPTRNPVRESPTLKLKDEVAEYITAEVDRKVEALRKASLLVHPQGQEGHERNHGEALPNFPTQGHAGPNLPTEGPVLTPSEAQAKSLTERAAYHAAMLEDARRDTNSTTFSYGSREEGVPVVQPATGLRTGWSFVGFPGYQEHNRGPWQQEYTQAAQTQFQNNLRDTVVAGVVAGIGEAQSHSNRSAVDSNRSAVTLTLSRLTAEITILLGVIPIKGGGIHTDSQEWGIPQIIIISWQQGK